MLIFSIPGVIAEYTKPWGVVLLKPEVLELDRVVEQYRKSGAWRNLWRAKFNWSAVAEKSKRMLLAEARGQLRKDDLVGLLVLCHVRRSERYDVEHMEIDLSKGRLQLPLTPKQIEYGRNRYIPMRKPGLHSFTTNDHYRLGYPGYFYRAAGGRKPGSHSS